MIVKFVQHANQNKKHDCHDAIIGYFGSLNGGTILHSTELATEQSLQNFYWFILFEKALKNAERMEKYPPPHIVK